MHLWTNDDTWKAQGHGCSLRFVFITASFVKEFLKYYSERSYLISPARKAVGPFDSSVFDTVDCLLLISSANWFHHTAGELH